MLATVAAPLGFLRNFWGAMGSVWVYRGSVRGFVG